MNFDATIPGIASMIATLYRLIKKGPPLDRFDPSGKSFSLHII